MLGGSLLIIVGTGIYVLVQAVRASLGYVSLDEVGRGRRHSRGHDVEGGIPVFAATVHVTDLRHVADLPTFIH